MMFRVELQVNLKVSIRRLRFVVCTYLNYQTFLSNVNCLYDYYIVPKYVFFTFCFRGNYNKSLHIIFQFKNTDNTQSFLNKDLIS